MGEQPRSPDQPRASGPPAISSRGGAEKDWAWTDQKTQMFAAALCVLPIVFPGAPPVVRCVGAVGAFGTLAWLAMEVPKWTRVRSRTWKTAFYAVAAVGILILVGGMYFALIEPPDAREHGARITEPIDFTRTFVPDTVTPEFLASLYHGHTKEEGGKLLDLYRGKWMYARGTVKNVNDFEFGGKHVTLQIGPGGFLDRIFGDLTDTNVIAYFDSTWDDQISALHGGDRISIAGNVDTMSNDGLVLQSCELRSPR
ncbi:MAG TPA: hypothetical protein VGU66_05925 [Candidatus Elarobacter sp.]|nr:hypothetical protein [Candidatus Elarobacter sp.]